MIPEKVEGNTILLRPLEEADARQVCDWRNHPDIARFFHRKHIEPDAYIKWMREVAADPNQGLYAIVAKSDSALLGTIAFKLNRTENKDITATLGIMIGNPACRGQGFGEEGMEVIAKDLADRFGVVKTIVEVLQENMSAIAFYEKLGYSSDMIVMSRKTKPRD
jgi:RimJ/RimL family protein N-acetyltransferase